MKSPGTTKRKRKNRVIAVGVSSRCPAGAFFIGRRFAPPPAKVGNGVG